jgi:hypothetical protein
MKIKGEPVPIPFGFGGWVSFKKTTDGKSAMVMSDTVLQMEEVNLLITAARYCMLQSEVNPVIKTLRANNLEVVAVHNHMLGDDPHMIFLHYYGRGNAVTLAQGFPAALDILGKNPERMGSMKM